MAENDRSGVLYPSIEPFNTGKLEVSKVHTLYYEQCGNKNGIPVVYLHGGPGLGIMERDRRYFDPKAYHIVLFDQRGAGKSTPAFCLEDNDTWHLVEDIEKLRTHLNIDRWVVFGGSWGSTLSLAYAETHIDRVLGLIMWGIFTFRPEEVHWLYEEGASYIFPDYWEKYYEAVIPPEERNNHVQAYYKRLTGDDEEIKLKCAKSWAVWEVASSQLRLNPENIARCDESNWTLAFARIECHFMVNQGFVKSPTQLLDNAKIIADSGVPVSIVQGRYDIICPPRTAWALSKRLPNSEITFVDDAGHLDQEVGTTKKLVEATDKFKTLIKL